MDMTRTTIALLPVMAVVMLTLGGCAHKQAPRHFPSGTISHVVLITLDDPAGTEELIADSDRMLGTIPSVVDYTCGIHHETGRDTVRSDYTVALIVTFDSDQGYSDYLVHPDHIELVKKWKPQATNLTIYDFMDD